MAPPATAQVAPSTTLAPLLPALGQLVQGIDELRYEIEFRTDVPLASWPDLCRRYALLAAQAHAITSQLLPVPGPAPPAGTVETTAAVQERERAWSKSLGRLVALPATGVPESSQTIVGVLLRTLQEPSLDAAHAALVAKLPADLQVASQPRAADPSSAEPLEPALERLGEAIGRHDRLAAFALRKARAISGLGGGAEEDDLDALFDGEEDEDEREPYDWKLRPVLDEGDEDDDADEDAMEGVEVPDKPAPPSVPLSRWSALLREGRLPPA